ncbi:MAG: NAD(+) synthase [bacterium]
MAFSKDVLTLDCAATYRKLSDNLVRQMRDKLKKSGVVIGISGGIDSTLCAALCAKSLGPQRVLGVMMPEQDSSPESRLLAEELAATFGFETVVEEITGGLAGMGCYERRDEAIKQVFPDFQPTWKSKITIGNRILDSNALNFFNLTIEDDHGRVSTKRMPLSAYLQVVAASNLKQRLRMTTLYYHAERRNWAVIGTGNKDEHMQGFFVKYGDGGADVKPIAHLYKVQVYQLAAYLGVPKSIMERTPTTDTYSSEVTQEEFFFGLDFDTMDLIWWAMEHDVPASEVAPVLNFTEEQVRRAMTGIQRKIVATEYLRMKPLEIDG